MSARKQTFRTVRTGKRRKIRKRIHNFSPENTLAAGNDLLLDTIEEVETLVRLVGNLVLVPLIADPGLVKMAIKLNPGGTELAALVSGVQTEEGRDANAILWHAIYQSSASTADQPGVIFDIDVKGMRKVEKGDTIELYLDADGDNGYVINGYLSMFYKKA